MGAIVSKKITILQINTCNYGSTGNIMLDLAKAARQKGYDAYVSYANYSRNKTKKVDNCLLIGNYFERNMHLRLNIYTGYNGCFSRVGTWKFLNKVKKIKPDIIHLHNLHNCYINLGLLFKFIKKNNIPVVWTLHDCWAFTGQCPHFTVAKCTKWETGCYNCTQFREYPVSRVDNTKTMYELKKKWFTGMKNTTLVTPSKWLADLVGQSYLKGYPVKVINNGLNLNIFKPTPSDFRNKFNIKDQKIILGVANPWTNKKGLHIFNELAEKLDDTYKIVLVGLKKKQMPDISEKILGIMTSGVEEMAQYYTAADIFVNPSMEETMGLVTVEALACGTPVIVSNATAIPEMVGPKCGVIVENYSFDDFYNAIVNFNDDYMQEDLISWAKTFASDIKYEEYMQLYTAIK